MFTFEGQEYASRTACGVQLVANGMKIGEAAKKVGVDYSTIYVNTSGKEKRLKQIAKSKAKKLMSSGKNYSRAEISRRTGICDSSLKKMFTNITTNEPVSETTETVTENPVQ